MPFLKYSKLINFRRASEILNEPEVVVTEKIHGTSARFGWADGKLYVGARNTEYDPNGDPSGHFGFVGWVRKNVADSFLGGAGVPDGESFTIYGEFYGGGIQKQIKYQDEKRFKVYDIRTGNEYWAWDDVKGYCEAYDLEYVPELYRGPANSEKFFELRDGPSTVGEGMREGIVIRPPIPKKLEKRTGHPFDGEWLIVKLKSPAFEEVFSGKPSKSKTGEDSLGMAYAQCFASHYVTQNRLYHCLDSLRESGHQCVDLTDMGNVLCVMSKDIMVEGAPDMPPNVEWKVIAKLITPKIKALYTDYVQRKALEVTE